MKPKTMILMVIAIACGLGASYMTSQLLAERDSSREVAKVPVLVAKKKLDQGTPLKHAQDLFEEKLFDADQKPEKAVTGFDQMKDKFLKRDVLKGYWVTAEDLIDQPSTLPIPEGYRAVGLRVNMETIAGGFASLPGSHVDILWTVRRSSDDETHTQALLENVLVLAADSTKERGTDVHAMPASVVTVALSPEDVMRATMAKESGQLTLVLRNGLDTTRVETHKVTLTDILTQRPAEAGDGAGGAGAGGAGGDDPLAVPQLPPVAPPPAVAQGDAPPPLSEAPSLRKHVVRITEGAHVRKEVFLLNDKGEVVLDEVTGADPEGPAAEAPPALAPAAPATEAAPRPRPLGQQGPTSTSL